MDARGHVHMMDIPTSGPPRHTGFVTKDPMPEQCDARKVLSALDKLAARGEGALPPKMSDAALLPLTPFERGYVLGALAEYRSWKAQQP
jgi:hypothetical protein